MANSINNRIEAHFSQYGLRKFPKGQILIHAGDQPQYIYYLKEGRVRQYDISYRGDEVIVNVFREGSFFPLLPVITGLHNRYFFEAETAIETRLAPIDKTVEFLKSDPEVLFDLLRRVYIGLDGILERTLHMMSGSAKSRVLYELLIESRRFGTKTAGGGFYIDIHENDLAGRAGLSRETVSREIQKIGKDGLIKASRNGILISDLSLLEKKLGTEI